MNISTLIFDLNAKFGPAFVFDEGDEMVERMFLNAVDAVELVLGFTSDEQVYKEAARRVIDAFRILFYGEYVA